MSKYVVLLAMVLAAGVTMAQEAAENLQAEVLSVNRQLSAVKEAAMRSPEAEAKRAAALKTNEAYREAVNNLDGIKAIDEEVAALRTKLRDLQKQRRDIIEANKALLAEKENACRTASSELQAVLEGGESGQALKQRRQALTSEMAQLQQAQPVSSDAQPRRPISQP